MPACCSSVAELESQARREAELLHAREINQLAFMRHPTMIKVILLLEVFNIQLWQIITDAQETSEEEVGKLLAEAAEEREAAADAVSALAAMKCAAPVQTPDFASALREGGWPAVLETALQTVRIFKHSP